MNAFEKENGQNEFASMVGAGRYVDILYRARNYDRNNNRTDGESSFLELTDEHYAFLLERVFPNGERN